MSKARQNLKRRVAQIEKKISDVRTTLDVVEEDRLFAERARLQERRGIKVPPGPEGAP